MIYICALILSVTVELPMTYFQSFITFSPKLKSAQTWREESNLQKKCLQKSLHTIYIGKVNLVINNAATEKERENWSTNNYRPLYDEKESLLRYEWTDECILAGAGVVTDRFARLDWLVRRDLHRAVSPVLSWTLKVRLFADKRGCFRSKR